MAPSVEETHPTGLQQPKIVQKLANGTKPHDPDARLTNGNTPVALPEEAILHEEGRVAVDARAILALRNLIFDICNHNGGGHGGSALGMAAIGVALYKYVMRYNPSDPSWFDRDRFVLSNGTFDPRH